PLGVRRNAPLDAAQAAAPARTIAPDLLSLPVRIERVDHAGLLSGDHELPAAGERGEDRRRAEIEIRAGALAAVDVADDAPEHVRPRRGHPERPETVFGS